MARGGLMGLMGLMVARDGRLHTLWQRMPTAHGYVQVLWT